MKLLRLRRARWEVLAICSPPAGEIARAQAAYAAYQRAKKAGHLEVERLGPLHRFNPDRRLHIESAFSSRSPPSGPWPAEGPDRRSES
jgi:hypothetical protein